MWLPVSALSEGRKGLWTVFTVVDRDGHDVIACEAVEILHVEGEKVFARGTIESGAHIVQNGSNRIISGLKVALAGAD